jgi:hypothetical protein
MIRSQPHHRSLCFFVATAESNKPVLHTQYCHDCSLVFRTEYIHTCTGHGGCVGSEHGLPRLFPFPDPQKAANGRTGLLEENDKEGQSPIIRPIFLSQVLLSLRQQRTELEWFSQNLSSLSIWRGSHCGSSRVYIINRHGSHTS